MREVDANETSVELGSAFGGTLVGLSQLSVPKLDPLIEPSILFLLYRSILSSMTDGAR